LKPMPQLFTVILAHLSNPINTLYKEFYYDV
jgi:hypothetical protein